MAYFGGTVLVIGVILALNGSWMVAGALFVLTMIVVELYAIGAPASPTEPAGGNRADRSRLVRDRTALG